MQDMQLVSTDASLPVQIQIQSLSLFATFIRYNIIKYLITEKEE